MYVYISKKYFDLIFSQESIGESELVDQNTN